MHRLTIVLSVALASSACLRSTTTIDLRPDGSGTVVQENGVSPQALAMLKGFAPAADQKGGSPEIFSEAQAKKVAASMGVTFVSGEPFKTADLEGYRARYSFTDISKVMVNMQGDPTGMSGGTGSKSGEKPFGFGFTRGSTTSTVLIQMPEPKPGSGPLGELPGQLPGADKNANPQQVEQALTMMKTMMKGLFVDIALNVEGRIVKTNAPFVDGSRVTLLQIDFDKLLADPSALTKLQGASDLKSLANIPGLKMLNEPKVTVEFGR
jgi:hypothetical protein